MATISLHKIRWERGLNGARLWVRENRWETVVGGVFLAGGTGRWRAFYMGEELGVFETEELAREVTEAVLQTQIERETGLT